MRPGYLRNYGESKNKPGNLGIIYTNALPSELEVGYIPEHLRYSNYFPYNLVERRRLHLRDPMTFNTLMI